MRIVEDQVPFSGDAARAFDTARQTLLPLGFRVESEGATRLVVSGPGMNSTRQNALLGVSRAEFNAERGSLRVRAELGGVDRLQRFLILLMLGLGLFDSLIFIGLWYFFDQLRAHTWFLAIPALTLAPWIFIGPFIARLIARNTEKSLNTLLQNMATRA